MSSEPIVFVVDDDPVFNESLCILITALGWTSKGFTSADNFLATLDPVAAGIVTLDVRLPNTNGLLLQERLAALPTSPPVIVITGHAEVPIATRAMRQGAVDFLPKSFRECELFDALQRATAIDAKRRAEYLRQQELADRFSQLTKGETDVLQQVVSGEPNKRIAASLRISRRTVEDRRARIMQKLRVETLADLVRVTAEAERWISVTAWNSTSTLSR